MLKIRSQQRENIKQPSNSYNIGLTQPAGLGFIES